MAEPSNAGIVKVGEERIIPGSQRADGSFRKERKVRPGFVPLEDIKRYVIPQRATNPGSGKPGIPGSRSKPVIQTTKKEDSVPIITQAKKENENSKKKVLELKVTKEELEQKAVKVEHKATKEEVEQKTAKEEAEQKATKEKVVKEEEDKKEVSLSDEMSKLSI